jgi:hypothetical protein
MIDARFAWGEKRRKIANATCLQAIGGLHKQPLCMIDARFAWKLFLSAGILLVTRGEYLQVLAFY